MYAIKSARHSVVRQAINTQEAAVNDSLTTRLNSSTAAPPQKDETADDEDVSFRPPPVVAVFDVSEKQQAKEVAAEEEREGACIANTHVFDLRIVSNISRFCWL